MDGWALKSKSSMRQGDGEVREAHPSGQSAGLGGVDLDCEELFEELCVGPQRRARLTTRAQPPVADPAHERRIRRPIAQSHNLAEQHRRPHMGIINQPLTHIVRHCVEGIGTAAGPHPRLPPAGQVGPHRLAVQAQMAGDRRDRPSLCPQCVNLHVFSMCDHLSRGSSGR